MGSALNHTPARIILQYAAVITLACPALFPASALAAASLSRLPAGDKVRSPVTYTVQTTGPFADTVDGIGCDDPSFLYWGLRLVLNGATEIFGIPYPAGTGNVTEQFALPLGLFSADIACKTENTQNLFNGGGNNPALVDGFSVVPYSYVRSPSGTLPGPQVTFSIAFDGFFGTGCDASANYWGIVLYDRFGENLLASSPLVASTTLDYVFAMDLPAGDYGTVEMVCSADGSTYGSDVLVEDGGGASIFNVLIGSVSTPAYQSAGGGSVAPLPTISFITPQSGDAAAKSMHIAYEIAFDSPEPGVAYDTSDLYVTSVTLFSLRDADATGTPPALIAEGLSARGERDWDVSGLPEGDDYRIIALVRDSRGRETRLESEPFGIDRTPPQFILDADPQVSAGEEVTISVTSGEDLDAANPPVIFVTQESFGTQSLTATGSARKFTATYAPVTGHDGAVTVSVKGKDKAGNEGDQVLSGGIFYVGIDAPPAPVIVSPLDNDVVASSSTDITGITRPDTTVTLSVNGAAPIAATTTNDGRFGFSGIALSKTFERGLNLLSFTAHDHSGHVSKPAIVRVKYNISPDATITFPNQGDVLKRVAILGVRAKDTNGDPLFFDYELRPEGDERWITLARHSRDASQRLRTMDFPDGAYVLRVTVDDGNAAVVLESGQFSIRNDLPVVQLSGERTVETNKQSFTVTGTVDSPKAVAVERSPITLLEYRLSGGEWQALRFSGATNDQFHKTFSIIRNDLSEGVYTIDVRAKDARGYFGIGSKTVIVDFGPPAAPVPLTPSASTTLSFADDTDRSLAGVQFAVTGTAEPFSVVEVSVNGARAARADTATSGAFVARGVTLRTHGNNMVSLSAIDAAGNVSPLALLPVVMNNPPLITIRSPRSDRGLNHTALIRFEIADPDGDPVSPATIRWRSGAVAEWRTLAAGISARTYQWNVTGLPEARDYELAIEATDGVSVGRSSVRFAVDNTPPEILVAPLTASAFRKALTLTLAGTARDDFSGIEYVEYSLDGISWYKGLVTKGFLTKSAVFSVTHPAKLSDGEYTVHLRAVDAAGNVSPEETRGFVVDSTPPRVGSHRLLFGKMGLTPAVVSSDNRLLPEYRFPAGAKLSFVLSLERDTASSILSVLSSDTANETAGTGTPSVLPERTTALSKDGTDGLWKADITLEEEGTYMLAVSALDRLGNSATRHPLARVVAGPPGIVMAQDGTPLSGATIRIRALDEESGILSDWDAGAFGARNTAITDQDGRYALFLPGGTYGLVIEHQGYVRIKTSEFTLARPSFVGLRHAMAPREGVSGVIDNLIEQLSFR